MNELTCTSFCNKYRTDASDDDCNDDADAAAAADDVDRRWRVNCVRY